MALKHPFEILRAFPGERFAGGAQAEKSGTNRKSGFYPYHKSPPLLSTVQGEYNIKFRDLHPFFGLTYPLTPHFRHERKRPSQYLRFALKIAHQIWEKFFLFFFIFFSVPLKRGASPSKNAERLPRSEKKAGGMSGFWKGFSSPASFSGFSLLKVQRAALENGIYPGEISRVKKKEHKSRKGALSIPSAGRRGRPL
ncbi:MAG: hypothetical protein LBR53_06230 [Deltaproteobacteria bacterium]|nr:hypothetical protein [Deltaproteobacteria bacterium]